MWTQGHTCATGKSMLLLPMLCWQFVLLRTNTIAPYILCLVQVWEDSSENSDCSVSRGNILNARSFTGRNLMAQIHGGRA